MGTKCTLATNTYPNPATLQSYHTRSSPPHCRQPFFSWSHPTRYARQAHCQPQSSTISTTLSATTADFLLSLATALLIWVLISHRGDIRRLIAWSVAAMVGLRFSGAGLQLGNGKGQEERESYRPERERATLANDEVKASSSFRQETDALRHVRRSR